MTTTTAEQGPASGRVGESARQDLQDQDLQDQDGQDQDGQDQDGAQAQAGSDRLPPDPEQRAPEQRAEAQDDELEIKDPGKLLRLSSMLQATLQEMREVTVEADGRELASRAYHETLEQLHDVLPDELDAELDDVELPVDGESSQASLQLAQARLVGWLQGLFQGLQATALMAQHEQRMGQLREADLATERSHGTYI